MRMLYAFIYYYAFLYINYDFILYPIIWGNFPIDVKGQWGNFPIKVKEGITFLGIYSHRLRKGGEIEIIEINFIPSNEKSSVAVGFSKKEFKNHKGVSGLKYYLIVMYLRKHMQTFGEISLTLNSLLEECGYSTKSHNKSIYSDFREIIKTEIVNKGYATCSTDIFTVNPTEMFSLQLSDKKNIFYTKDNFVQFTIEEFETIAGSTGKINKSVLAGVYLFIKQYIMDFQDDIPLAKISYPSKQQIKKGI